MRIESLSVQEVGPFQAHEWHFETHNDPDKAEVNLFVGPNGSGKSTLLYALAAVFGNAGPLPALFWRAGDHPHVRIAVEGLNRTIAMKYAGKKKEFTLNEGQIYFGKPNQTQRQEMSLKQGAAKDEAPLRYPAKDALTNLYLKPKEWKKQTVFSAGFTYAHVRTYPVTELKAVGESQQSPLLDALGFPLQRDWGLSLQWLATAKTKLALAGGDPQTDTGPLRHIGLAVDLLEKSLTDISGLETTFEMQPHPLALLVRLEDKTVPVDGLGAGWKAILVWMVDLISRLVRLNWENDQLAFNLQPFLLFLDDVDQSLDESLARRLPPRLQLMFPNAQIFLSTRSGDVARSFEGCNLFQL